MSISALNNVTATAAVNTYDKTTDKTTKESTKAAEAKNNKQDSSKISSGVVYEIASSTVNTDYVKKNSALIQQLKTETDARISKLKGIEEQMMKKQGASIGKAEDMRDFADDGYWGVEQTSDRIVDFAIALSGGDPAKADTMLEAFKKGFKAATKSWGKELPDISQRTYDAVLKKMDAWKNGTEDATEE